MPHHAQLKERILTAGPLPVSEYMRLCNAHYYATQHVFGAKGDFITAPEISQIFGEICGAWLANEWLKHPVASAMVELGGGRGTLMKDLLRATTQLPQFHDNIDVVMVESSPQLARMQMDALAPHHPRVTSIPTLQLPEKPCYIIANEFFDALPIMQKVDGKERQVVLRGEGFGFQDSGGEIEESCPEGEAIMQQLCAHLSRYGGAMLIVDYGYANPATGDTLQAVKSHRYVDIFDTPGEADLTAHVNFLSLRDIAHMAGLGARITTQGEFLLSHGAQHRADVLGQQDALHRLTAPDAMGELFKVLQVVTR